MIYHTFDTFFSFSSRDSQNLCSFRIADETASNQSNREESMESTELIPDDTNNTKHEQQTTSSSGTVSVPEITNSSQLTKNHRDDLLPNGGSSTESSEPKTSDSGGNVTVARCTGHRAGFDAFMTGFILTSLLCDRGLFDKSQSTIDFSQLTDVLNNVYLSGKDIPLQVRKGSFAKTSKNHEEKRSRILATL